MKEKFKGYSWIEVKRFKDDPSLTWEERFKLLEHHHIEETTFLIEKVRELAGMIDDFAQYEQHE